MATTISISEKNHLTESEAEAYTGFSRKKLFEFRTKGTSKGRLQFSMVGSSIRYSKKDIDQFIEKHKV